uniref:Uncharacterized protein n=1 Tax=Oryza rufipogon TaxID=4529 RepID=A0A0E0NG61_ORYRU
MDEQPELAQDDQGRVAWKGDALHQVLGEEKPGQVHGMGLLPVPNHQQKDYNNLINDLYDNSSIIMMQTRKNPIIKKHHHHHGPLIPFDKKRLSI